MSGNTEDVGVRLRLQNALQFKRGMDDAARSTRKMGAESAYTSRTMRTLDATNRRVAGSMLALGKRATSLAGIGGLAGLAVGAKQSIEAASNLSEEMNKASVVFRGSQRDILAWSAGTSTALGISRREALESAGVFGNMLVPMGFARSKAEKMSKSLVTLASDMASFNNANPSDVLEALRSGLSGEIEPLRKYGVFLNQGRIATEAATLGYRKQKGQLSNTAKAQAIYNVILRDTKDAHGDFARTSSGAANQTRIFHAQLENVEGSMGKGILPAFNNGLQTVNKFMAGMQHGTGAGGEFARTLHVIGRDADIAYKGLKPVVTFLGHHKGAVAEVAGSFALISGSLTAVSKIKRLTGLGTVAQALGGRGLGGRGATPRNPMWVAVVNGGTGATPGGGKGGKGGALAKGVGAIFGYEAAHGLAMHTPLKRYSGRKGWANLAHDLGHGLGSLGKAMFPPVPGHAMGGLIGGEGYSDTIPARLKPGEYVVRREAVRRMGVGALDRINHGGADDRPIEITVNSILDGREVAKSVHKAAMKARALS